MYIQEEAFKIAEDAASDDKVLNEEIIKKAKIKYANLKLNKCIRDAFRILRTIPQMQHVLNNLPDDLTYRFHENMAFSNVARFDMQTDTLVFALNRFGSNMSSDKKLIFYSYLAHELCHANQKAVGIDFQSLKNPTFSSVFRANKLMEADALLLQVKVENGC